MNETECKYELSFNIDKYNKIYILNIFYHDNKIYVFINNKMIYTCNENHNVMKYIHISNNLLSFVENSYIYFYDVNEIINNNFVLSKINKKIQILKNEIPKFCDINKKTETKYELSDFDECFFIDGKFVIILNSLEFGKLLIIQNTTLITTKKLELHDCLYYMSENCMTIMLIDNKKELNENLINLFSYDGNINYLCTIVTNDIIYNICCSDNNNYICYIYNSIFGTYIKIYNVQTMKWTYYKINNVSDISLIKILFHNVIIIADYNIIFIYDNLNSIIYYFIFTNENEITNYKIDFIENIKSFDTNTFNATLINNQVINIKYEIYINLLNKIFDEKINSKKIKVNIDNNIKIIHKKIYEILNDCNIINFDIFIDIIYNNECLNNKEIIDDCKLLLDNKNRIIIEIIILKIFLISKDISFIENFISEFKYFDKITHFLNLV